MRFNYPHLEDFVKSVIGIDLLPWQLEFAQEYNKFARRESSVRLGAYCGHGVGKTTFAAWCILHSLLCFPGGKIAGVATANTRAQLLTKLLREVRKQAIAGGLYDVLKITSDGVCFGEIAQISFVTWNLESTESFAGLHEENCLIVYDEASAIPPEIWETTEGATSGNNFCWLAFGNPTRSTGMFRRIHDETHGVGRGWLIKHVSSVDVPIVDRAYVKSIEERYGYDSSIYKVRVLGEYADSTSGGLFFSTKEMENLRFTKKINFRDDMEYMVGIDVARFGDCHTVMAVRQASNLKLFYFPSAPLTDLANMIILELGRLTSQPQNVVMNIDGTGVGGGLVDLLVHSQRTLNEVIFSSRSPIVEGVRLLNIRTFLHWQLKMHLQKGQLFLDEDGVVMQLRNYLSDIMAEYDPSDYLKLNKKNRSAGVTTDIADAIALTFY